MESVHYQCMSPGLADRIRACPTARSHSAPFQSAKHRNFFIGWLLKNYEYHLIFFLHCKNSGHLTGSKSSAFGEMEEEGCIVTIPTYSTKHEEGVKDGYTVPFPPH